MKLNYKIVCILTAMLILTSSATALIQEKDLKELTKESKNIIMGKVTDQKSYWEDGKIFTDVTILVEQNIKGKTENQITIKVPGGTVEDTFLIVSDTPSFDNNEEVVLFLRDEYFQVVGWFQGKYTVKDKKVKETGDSVDEFISKIKQIMLSPSDIVIDNTELVSKEYAISSITPTSGPAKAATLGSTTAAADSTQVTITGSGFGATPGNVKFWRTGSTTYNAAIVSWSDTQIVARVPGRVSSYYRSGTLGNVEVIKSDLTSAGTTNFYVTYSYGGGKWPGTSLTYKVNANTADTTGELAAVRAGATTWNGACANFNYNYGGTTTVTGYTYDGENSIMWVGDNGAIAIAYTWGSGNTIVESDIEFNDALFTWGTDGSPTSMDVQTIATHELGHWLQLLDLYGTADRDSGKVMYGFGSNGLIKRNLATEDIDGIRAIYGRSPTCLVNYVFVRGLDNGLWYRTFNGAWGPWTGLGGIISDDPDATTLNSKVYVFARGTDNALWYRIYDGSWGAWASLGGIINSSPGVSSSWSGRIYVFIRGADNALWYRSFDGTSWTGWASLGGIINSGPGAT